MILQNMFISLFAYDYLDVDNEALEKFCRHEIQKEVDVANITQSLFVDINSPELRQLTDQIKERMSVLHTSLGLDPSMNQELHRAWCNLNTPYDINVPHCHPESYFTGVYYVKTYDGCPPLTFMTPVREMEYVIRPQHIKELNHFNAARWSVPAETGKLVIFPSWLIHYVVGENKGDRISIAFDTVIK